MDPLWLALAFVMYIADLLVVLPLVCLICMTARHIASLQPTPPTPFTRQPTATECSICLDMVCDTYCMACPACPQACCVSCLTTHVHNKVADKCRYLGCPSCGTALGAGVLGRVMTASDRVKHDQLAHQSVQRAFKCPRCHAKCVKTTEDYLACTGCRATWCSDCDGRSHYFTFMCKQRAFRRWRVKHDVRQCPQCRCYIEKVDGCHMTCTRCKLQFCWTCHEVYPCRKRCDVPLLVRIVLACLQ
ncbi:hypothetical protein H257_18016 [Aphanomyces astaci]|uniref:RING-type domain-containing protein n=1 Tax=Aphanomyces astaci TaxID=112090 RepID=W4FE85_APHAT|nr:hypothetical protein H257_18016 [Aphanomyces astaci]ETV65184.1 hypothetical protein H257_18016 [Aphanomyces astaci]|eukprot:XP_009845308.1 hypothetical protein H257_18016 [Aphanomyces astaci]